MKGLEVVGELGGMTGGLTVGWPLLGRRCMKNEYDVNEY